MMLFFLRILVLFLLATVVPGQETISDQTLEQRLESIFESVQGLEQVQVEVSFGVVTLTGEVLSESARTQSEELASQLQGVVEVQNQIEVSTDVSERLGSVVERFEKRVLAMVYQLPLLLVGLLVLIAAWLFGGWLSGRAWLYRRIQHNPFLRDILAQLIRAAIFIAVALFVLDLLELTALVGAVLGAAGLATLAVGFAFRDLIENYIASILLSLRQPFEPNDLVLIGDHCGRVSRLTSRATILITPEGNHVRIPNSMVFKSEMVNYSKNPRRRFDFEVGVDVALELLPVQALAEETVASIDGVLQDPPPFCLVTQLGDSNVVIRVHGWVDQTSHQFTKVRSEAIRKTKEAFDSAGIVMPEPIYNIKLLEKGRLVEVPAEKKKPKVASLGDDSPAGADTRSGDEIIREVQKEMGEGENLLDKQAEKE